VSSASEVAECSNRDDLRANMDSVGESSENETSITRIAKRDWKQQLLSRIKMCSNAQDTHASSWARIDFMPAWLAEKDCTAASARSYSR